MPTTTTGVATEFINFSRASNATVTDSNGRIDWARHNLLLASEQFDASNYSKTNITVTANNTVAPNGTTTADKVEATATAATVMFQATSAVNGPCTFSIWVKKGNIANRMNTFLVRNSTTATNLLGITVNYDTGSFVYDIGSTGAVVENAGSSWWKITMTVTSGVNQADTMIFYTGAAGSSYTAGDHIFLWGAHLYRSDMGMQANTSAYPMYNPTTPKNLLGFTETFSDSYWTKLRATITANSATAPNGLVTADTLVEDNTAANSHFTSSGLFTAGTSGTYTYSCYLKAKERTWAQLEFFRDVGYRAYFNLTGSGAVGTTENATASITSVGDGWYRCSIRFTVTTGGVGASYVFLADANNSRSYNGDGTSGIYLWGAQLSDSASLDPYTPNHFAAPSAAAYYGPRLDYDPVTLAAKGLLVEEQRTNIALYSDQFNNAVWIGSFGGTGSLPVVTQNAATAPDGTTTADRIQFALNGGSTVNDISSLLQNVTFTANPHTFSIWMKSNTGSSQTVVLMVQGTQVATVTVTTSWQRFSVTFTTSAITSNFGLRIRGTFTGDAADVLVWGAQLEAGSFATSYIPTTSATVTRSADVAQVGTAAFPYSATEGTVVVNFAVSGIDTSSRRYAWFGADAGNQRLALRALDSSINYPIAAIGTGTSVASLNGTALTANTATKVGVAYGTNMALSQNGANPATDASAASVSMTQFNFGGSTVAAYLNGWIRQFTYIPRRISNAELQNRSA